MCLALGLNSSHAIVTEQGDAVQRKICLFWAVYVLEKTVALRLGRPSTIRDQDITIPRLTTLIRRIKEHNKLSTVERCCNIP